MSIFDPVGQPPNMNGCSRVGTGSRSVGFVARLLSFVKVACAALGLGLLVVDSHSDSVIIRNSANEFLPNTGPKFRSPLLCGLEQWAWLLYEPNSEALPVVLEKQDENLE
jgi:hypothetical protein